MLIKQGLIQELKTELQLAVLSFKNWNWYSVPQIPIRAQRPSGTLKVTLFCCYCKKCDPLSHTATYHVLRCSNAFTRRS